jgi:hypothetical protein
MTTEDFIALCKSNGLNIAEIDALNIGQICDILFSYNDIMCKRYGGKTKDNNDDVRDATQEDMDTFFGE